MNVITTKTETVAAPAATPIPRPAPAPLPRASRIMPVIAQVMPPVIVLIGLVVLWEVLASGPNATLPPPSRVWKDAHDLIVDPFFDRGGLDKGLFWHLLASLQRVALGFTISAVVGVAVGMLIGTSQFAMRGLDPIFQVLRTVPPLAWLPLSLAAFREAQPSAIFVIFITAVWPVIINTAVGVRNVPQDYRNVAAVIQLRGIGYFWRIVMPAAAPYIFTGLRIGIGLSWLAIIAAEMLIGGVGIGFFVWDAWNSSNLSDIIVALIYVGIVGFFLDRLVALAGHLVTRGTSAS
ncbi:nitrate ABC transporter permease [Plastoroseomonas arctica]|uniref:Nitrate ABC transporter permease n=1 Tax=Plastoroseomonas arctica TaxID=1509237 RepID=A0AAF1K3Z6_9PROT|nr:nitrate ABC transporter permease [Plastoroseomonas arctica]MBR0656283.1 nitrate ABC transporter permease [Plastoroseomonas arctica]